MNSRDIQKLKVTDQGDGEQEVNAAIELDRFGPEPAYNFALLAREIATMCKELVPN